MTDTDRSSSRGAVRSRLWTARGGVAGLLVAVLAVVAVVGLFVWHTHDETYVVPSSATSGRPALEQPAEAAAALSAWQQAIGAHQVDPALGTAASVAAQNARRLRLDAFTARYIAPAGAVAADGSWTADVALTWRFGGVDASTAQQEVGVTFAPAGDDRVEIRGFGDAGDRRPLWLSGPVQVRRTGETMVVLAGADAASARRADRFVALARKAVATVRRVLPWPDAELVLEVPADQTVLEEMMGAAPGSYRGVAAVTATVDGSSSGPVHVLVNPQVIGGLNSEGAQIVLSHEAVHVATFEADAAVPSWLLEGFADYVALRDVTLPLSTTARQIIADVRAHGAPRQLPGAAEFDDQSESFGAEYEAAWLACRLLAHLAGEPALVRLYDAVRDGTALDVAMRRETGLTVAGFTAQWRRELTELAR